MPTCIHIILTILATALTCIGFTYILWPRASNERMKARLDRMYWQGVKEGRRLERKERFQGFQYRTGSLSRLANPFRN